MSHFENLIEKICLLENLEFAVYELCDFVSNMIFFVSSVWYVSNKKGRRGSPSYPTAEANMMSKYQGGNWVTRS